MHYMCFESSAVFLSLCLHCSDSALGYTTKGLSQSCSDKYYHVFLYQTVQNKLSWIHQSPTRA